MTYILPLCAAINNGVTPYFLALLKAARLSTKDFVASRFPLQGETCSDLESSVSVMLSGIPYLVIT